MTGPIDESKIISQFKSAKAGDLNQVLQGLNLHELFEDVDDYPWPMPQNRTALFEVLTKDRLPELSIPTRAAIVSALAKGKTGHKAELAIERVFQGTSGAALTELKNRIDAGGDYHDLGQLVFHDIDDHAVRAHVLSHIQSASPPFSPDRRKLLSDIDDTLYANLKDPRYPKGTVYPGVLAFQRELSGGAHDGQTNLAFLTARPGDPAGAVEGMTHASLKKRGVEDHVVLSGDFLHMVGNEAIAAKKLQGYEQYRKLFPEYAMVFVGDSGQGDAILGENLRKLHATQTPVVFIHDLGLPEKTASERSDAAARGVVYFDTYVGAGVEAYKRGLISREGLDRIVASVQPELAPLPAKTAALFTKDLASAAAALE